MCSAGYYKDTTNDQCTKCPCNSNEESCSLGSDLRVTCNCRYGFSGSSCNFSGKKYYLMTLYYSLTKCIHNLITFLEYRCTTLHVYIKKTLYFISAYNNNSSNSNNLDISEITLKLTPSNSIIRPIDTIVNFTCSYNSSVPMEIDIRTYDIDLMKNNNSSDTEYGPYINFTGAAQRTLIVRVKQKLSMVVCSLYNQDLFQLGQISTLINPGAITKTISISSSNWDL